MSASARAVGAAVEYLAAVLDTPDEKAARLYLAAQMFIADYVHRTKRRAK